MNIFQEQKSNKNKYISQQKKIEFKDLFLEI